MNVQAISQMDRALKHAELRAEWAKRARTDPIAFIEFIIRTEKIDTKTGQQKRIKLAEMQEEMVEFCLKHRRGVIKASPKVGKSHIITLGLTLWLAGKDASFRCALGSLKQDFALFFTGAIMEHVEHNEDLHLVFPHMKPAEGKWSREKLYLDRGGARVVHPTWRAVGANTGQQGTRVIVNVLDDIQDKEHTDTELLSDKTLGWIYAGESRMDKFSGDMDLSDYTFGRRGYDDVNDEPDEDPIDFGGSISPVGTDIRFRSGYRWLITNALQPYDAAHKLVADDGWALLEACVADKDGKTRLPAVYTQSDIDNYSKVSASRDLYCKTRLPGEQLFHEAWISAGKMLGKGLRLRPSLDMETIALIRNEGGRIICGVDLASRKNKKSDHTVFFVALVATRSFFRRWFLRDRYTDMDSLLPPNARMTMPLWIERRKMHSPEIRTVLYDINDRFHPDAFVVEDNGSQAYIRQDVMVERRDIPVFPFVTGPLKSDAERGVEGGLTNDLAAGLTIIPSMPLESSPDTLVLEPEVEQWVTEMRDFTKGAHTGDTLMASWFVREFVFSHDHFMHQIDVAGVPIADDELRAVGFTDAEIQFTRPTNPEFEAMAAEAEAEHQESQAPAKVIPIDAAAKESAKKAAETERRMMGDLIRRQVGESAFAVADEDDPEIADIIASRF